MQNVTVRLREELIDRLDDEADERGVSRSEYIRDILDERHRVEELETKVDRLQDRLDAREQRISDLEDQLAKRSQLEEKVDTLAKSDEDPDPPFPVRWLRWYRNRGSE